jgi:PKD repeat protein
MRGTRIQGLRTVLLALSAAVVLSGVLAGGAGAVVVRGANGQVFGITPQAGVNPASIPGSLAAGPHNGARSFAAMGNLDYHSGPVLHSSAPYLIFWDPSSAISASSRALFTRYFTDVAATSTQATNVYSVDRQFTDNSGFADYRQTFNAATQAINDTQAYPTQDAVNCPRTSLTFPTCVTDAQMQAEVARLIAADGLPTGIGANAPIYFVVTPTNVNVCSTSTQCADNTFCAYHSEFTDGSSPVLYSPVARLILGPGPGQNPKACQFDGTGVVQEPNADSADVAIKFMSHEDNETITDPVHGTGWWDSATGQENGDNCNFWGSTVDPATGSNPNAFTPTLGGDATAGTLFNQSINGNHYYIQSEWSNGDFNCKMQPAPATATAGFTPAAGTPNPVGAPTSFAVNPGYTSVTWNYGDGSPPVFSPITNPDAPPAVSHTYGAAGSYAVTATLVDTHGNLVTSTHTVSVGSAPTSSFTATPSTQAPGTPISFNGTSSSDPDAGVSIASYSWNFGDGSGGSGATTSHAYSALGTYTVTLTLNNSVGLTANSFKQVTVDELPTAAFGAPKAAAAGVAVAFSGAASKDPDGSITSYSWSFGDHHTGSGRAPKHTYAKAGKYTVTLTVHDSTGLSATVSHKITVGAVPISRLAVKRNSKGTFLQVSVSGPGVLSVGSIRTRVGKAGKITIKISLSRSGLAALHKHHKLTLKVKIKFVTRAGVTSTKTVSVTFRG